MKSVVVFCGQGGAAALELLGKARELADASGGKVIALAEASGERAAEAPGERAVEAPGERAAEAPGERAAEGCAYAAGGRAEEGRAHAPGERALEGRAYTADAGDPMRLAASGADRILVMDCLADDCAQGARIARVLERLKPDAVLFPATVRGRFLSAWVAARLGAGLTADCTALALTPEGLLLQSRPAYGGSLTADILCTRQRPQMCSVRPGVFPLRAPYAGRTVLPERLALEPLAQRMRAVAFAPAEQGVCLQTAEIVVAGGKGVGGKAGFALLLELAKLLGGAVGATRGAVDAGWIGYAHQVGQTGVVVRPRLYIAFGVSGSVQHLVGMNGAETVIAVNQDARAPIFTYADFGIADDWETVAREMIRTLRALGKK